MQGPPCLLFTGDQGQMWHGYNLEMEPTGMFKDPATPLWLKDSSE